MTIRHWFYDPFPRLRQSLSRWWYEYISALDKDANVLFMNFGYASLDHDAGPLELTAEDEQHRYHIQLYHHVASAIDWHGLAVLEVGSGRGGGAAYIKRRFEPRSIIGIDVTTRAVAFCQRYYSIEGLTFARGNAERLPFADSSFDVVVNVESSVYYQRVERFLAEVARVLKRKGHFLYADIRYQDEVDTWRTQLSKTGLQLLGEEDITPNVVRALELDAERRKALVKRYMPKIFHTPCSNFAGAKGAELVSDSPRKGKRVYLSFTLQKTRQD